MDFINIPCIVYTKARMKLVIAAYKKIIAKMNHDKYYAWPITHLNGYLEYGLNQFIGNRWCSGVTIRVYDDYEKQGQPVSDEDLVSNRDIVEQKYLIDIVNLFTFICGIIDYTSNLSHSAFTKIWKASKYTNQCDVAMDLWDPICSSYMQKMISLNFTKAKMGLVIQGYNHVLDLMNESKSSSWKRDDVNKFLDKLVKLPRDKKNYKIYNWGLAGAVNLFELVCDKISYADNMSYDEYHQIVALFDDNDTTIVPVLAHGPMYGCFI